MSNMALMSFGLIADVQYADIDDAYNFSKTKIRHYRNAHNLLKAAISHWLTHKPQPQFILQLGDLIDGFNTRAKASYDALRVILETFQPLRCPVLHSFGNHEFYNFTRSEIRDTELFSAGRNDCEADPDVAYYTYAPRDRVKIVALDTYEVSVLGYEPCDEMFKVASKILEKRNPNQDKHHTDGMRGRDRRYAQFNGGMSEKQVDWLEKVLEDAVKNQVNVIITAHAPSYPENVDVLCLNWSCDVVMATLHKYASCVVCYVAGHDHDGGYAIDTDGIHHLTLPAVVETDEDTNAFATVNVYHDRLEVEGCGRVSCYTIPLRYRLA